MCVCVCVCRLTGDNLICAALYTDVRSSRQSVNWLAVSQKASAVSNRPIQGAPIKSELRNGSCRRLSFYLI